MRQRTAGARCAGLAAGAVLLLSAACGSSSDPGRTPAAGGPRSSTAAVPTSTPAGDSARRASAAAAAPPAHVVVVVEENHSAREILGNANAPYFNRLAGLGADLTNFHAITHPSEPNYVALFSGSTYGLTNDSCPHSFRGPNLGSQLRAAHRTFVGYSEALPRTGYRGCTHGSYARKHAPWTNFANVPASSNQPLTRMPKNFNRLPTVSFVIPDLDHDMHDGTVGQADRWLQQHVGAYASWARTHNSLLIVTWDEDDRSQGNRIPTFAVGQHVQRGRDSTSADLYSLSRTIEALYHLPSVGQTAHRRAIRSLWTGA
jgi:phosphatidylinositol-3-phosphatase